MCEDITKYMGDYFSPNTDGVIVLSGVPIVLITEGKEFNNFEIVRKIKRIRCKFYLVGSYDTEISNRSVRIAYNWLGEKAVELGGNAVIDFSLEESDITDDPIEDFNHTMSGNKKYSGMVVEVKVKPFKKWKIKKRKTL